MSELSWEQPARWCPLFRLHLTKCSTSCWAKYQSLAQIHQLIHSQWWNSYIFTNFNLGNIFPHWVNSILLCYYLWYFCFTIFLIFELVTNQSYFRVEDQLNSFNNITLFRVNSSCISCSRIQWIWLWEKITRITKRISCANCVIMLNISVTSWNCPNM